MADPAVSESKAWGLEYMTGVVSKLNVGYFWMLVNCLTSAAYVCISAGVLGRSVPNEAGA